MGSRESYVYPLLGSAFKNPFFGIASPGLGNCLFPFARALAYAEINGARLIWPEWFQLNIGPLLRGELVSRNYYKEFNTNITDVVLTEKLYRLSVMKRTTEPEALGQETALSNLIIEFEGMHGWFQPINECRDLLLPLLLNRVRAQSMCAAGTIGVHVRRGDFKDATYQELYAGGKRNLRTPIQWFAAAMQKACNESGLFKFTLFSDGSDIDLAPLTNEFDCNVVRGQSSMADIISLSSSSMIIGSRSTFSLWAYFFSEANLVLPEGDFAEHDSWLPATKKEIIYWRH